MAVSSYAVASYIAAVILIAVGLAVLGWRVQPLKDEVVALLVLCVMGVLGSSS